MHPLLPILAAATLTTATLAGTVPPDYGFQWSTIGDPGNRGTLDSEIRGFFANQHAGSVDYEYRMATTEVTVGQYFEFAQVYHPFYTANTGNVLGLPDFVGADIRLAWGEIMIRGGVSHNKPINMGWEYAARYVNWLHNGKVNEEWAFETGVYDTSTFTQNDDGSWNHQATRDPDATFWLPSLDEWTKAGYWDPNLNNGEGGYYQFANSSDTESFPGTERNAGFGDEFPLDVGSFPDVQSPWGILDLAGGVSEWTDSVAGGQLGRRYLLGSSHGEGGFGDLFLNVDMLGGLSTGGANFFPVGGIRLVSVVPTPGTVLVTLAAILPLRRRR